MSLGQWTDLPQQYAVRFENNSGGEVYAPVVGAEINGELYVIDPHSLEVVGINNMPNDFCPEQLVTWSVWAHPMREEPSPEPRVEYCLVGSMGPGRERFETVLEAAMAITSKGSPIHGDAYRIGAMLSNGDVRALSESERAKLPIIGEQT